MRPLDVHFIVVIVPVAAVTSGFPMSGVLQVCFYSILFNPALVWIPSSRITLLLVVFQMADVELVKKMLRAVLQANKGGVSLPRLQSEYKELTGEQIPHKQMGYNHLDALLASMPSLVHMERSRSGEVCDLSFWIDIY